ncbi:MmcQ/YjbR family DNA-binding protein [Streptomyces sp. NPDC048383]|uniref:MmcQ/YjbR family DNA-binding protein n=1 Tax=Streptomyces sp. NPDC048383 TaxID=3155386 RepID=UPI0034231D9B
MTTLAQLRRTALALPEAVEQPAAGGAGVVFRVRDRWFARTDADGELGLHLPEAEARRVLDAHPTARTVSRGTAAIGVRIPLGDLDGQQLNHWVRRAWLGRAPKALATARSAAATVTAGELGDLLRGIGNPATRALAAAGITTLDGVAGLRRAELAALHGVGPKAVRVLEEALAATGRAFRVA